MSKSDVIYIVVFLGRDAMFDYRPRYERKRWVCKFWWPELQGLYSERSGFLSDWHSPSHLILHQCGKTNGEKPERAQPHREGQVRRIKIALPPPRTTRSQSDLEGRAQLSLPTETALSTESAGQMQNGSHSRWCLPGGDGSASNREAVSVVLLTHLEV